MVQVICIISLRAEWLLDAFKVVDTNFTSVSSQSAMLKFTTRRTFLTTKSPTKRQEPFCKPYLFEVSRLAF
jgi:hypothetical protein